MGHSAHAWQGACFASRMPERIVPVAQEEAHVSKRDVETGVVRVRKSVQEHVEHIDEPLRHDEVDIEHVAINRVVEAPAPPREEGDMLIIPVYEEVVTVQRQWVLKEEIRLRRREVQTRHREQVTLRREQATVQRSSSNPEESKDGEDGSRNDGQPG
jgi:uncharacterized protein (TIGR02271 family)